MVKRPTAGFFQCVCSFLIIYLSREENSRVNVAGSHDHIPLSLCGALFSPMGSVALHPVRPSDDAFSLHTETMAVTHTLTCFCHTGGRRIARIPRRRTLTVTVKPSRSPEVWRFTLWRPVGWSLHYCECVNRRTVCLHNNTQSAHTHTHTHTHTHFHLDRTVL